MKNKALQDIVKTVKKEMIANGTIARINRRKEQHHAAAVAMGFHDAQAAYNALGKEFLQKANKG